MSLKYTDFKLAVEEGKTLVMNNGTEFIYDELSGLYLGYDLSLHVEEFKSEIVFQGGKPWTIKPDRVKKTDVLKTNPCRACGETGTYFKAEGNERFLCCSKCHLHVVRNVSTSDEDMIKTWSGVNPLPEQTEPTASTDIVDVKKPFDVLGHLRGGGYIQSEGYCINNYSRATFWQEKGKLMYLNGVADSDVLLKYRDWKAWQGPVEPKEPEIADGWWVCKVMEDEYSFYRSKGKWWEYKPVGDRGNVALFQGFAIPLWKCEKQEIEEPESES